MCGAYPDPLHCNSMGIVGRWLFNERGSRVVDVCRNFDAGAISGASWTGSKMGGGLRFDGSDDFVSIGKRIQLYADYNKPFSIGMWFGFHTYSGSGTYSLLGSTHQVGAYFDQFELNIASDKIRVILVNVLAANDGRIWDTTSALSLTTGRLYFVLWTYDGLNATSSTKFYFNGVSQAVTVTANVGDIGQSIWQSARLADKDLWIGRRNYSTGDQPFPGIIDQFIIANRAWTPDEVKRMYQNPWSGLICSTYEMEELERA